MKRTCFLSITLAAALAVGCGRGDADRAQNNAAATPGAVGTSGEARARDVSNADQDFVRDVAIANMAEMEMAKMALQKGTDANVKKFAQMMVDDHSKAGSRLQALASQHRIQVPAQVDEKHKDAADKLNQKQAADFDRDYAQAMVDGHQDLVDKLEARVDKEKLAEWKAQNVDGNTGKKTKAKGEAMTVLAEKSDNPVTQSLNQWAAETYPVAFAHLQAAKDLQKGARRRSTTP
jgi:putative membrane protein